MDLTLVSLPGVFPSFPAVGLEMIAHGLRARGHAVRIVNGHLLMLRFVHEEFLKVLCSKNIWELLYAGLVYSEAGLGLDNARVLRLLTNPNYDFGFRREDLDVARRAVMRFNRHLLRTIRARDTGRVVGFSVQNNQLLAAKYLAGVLKQRHGDSVRTIVGGASIRNGLGRFVLDNHAEFDFVSEAEGVEEIDALLHGVRPERIHGLHYRDSLSRVQVAPREGRRAGAVVDETELDYREFYDQRRFYEARCDLSIFHPFDGVPAMLSLGCRWSRCRFCNIREPYREFSPAKVASAIARRTRINLNPKVFLLDLCQPPDAIMNQFFDELDRRRIRCVFGAVLRCDIGHDTLERFVKHGLAICQIGLESYSDVLLDRMQKGVRVLDIVHTLLTCRALGVQVEGNLIVNLPWETDKSLKSSLELAELVPHVPLPRTTYFMLSHGSICHRREGADQAASWRPEDIVTYAYPKSMRQNLEHMYYCPGHRRIRRPRLWGQLIRKIYRQARNGAILEYEVFDDGILFHDTRSFSTQRRVFIEDRCAADIYMACTRIRTPSELSALFPSFSARQIGRVLAAFVADRYMLKSRGQYLSIALERQSPYRK